MRLFIAMAALACVSLAIPTYGVGQASPSSATERSATERANRLAYDAAVKCFVANGIIVSDKKDAGDKASAAAYESKARQSFDLAVKLGERLGLSGQHINQDFGLAQARELPKMVKDAAYFKQAAATCRALELM